jgi:type II secretory pathway predicted ATPase ExeA
VPSSGRSDGRAAPASHYHLPLKEFLRGAEREYLAQLLNQYQGGIARCARHASVDQATLHRKIKSHGCAPTTTARTGGCTDLYCDFYQMQERPFNVTADPKFLYLNARYREALASLHYGITQRKGFVTLIGEAGTGKTTLLKKLLDDLDQTTRTVFVFNTNVTFDEILEYIFGEFDLPVHNGKRLYMLQRLNQFLLEELGKGRNVALLIDERRTSTTRCWRICRLLSNLETAKEKILQIVPLGSARAGARSSGNPGLRQLRQRVAVNCRCLPLSREELSEYIQARLTAAGAADTKLFTRDAEERIFEISAGIPASRQHRLRQRAGDRLRARQAADRRRRRQRSGGRPADRSSRAASPATSSRRRRRRSPSTGRPRGARRGVSAFGIVAVGGGGAGDRIAVGRPQSAGRDAAGEHAAGDRPPLEVVQPGSRPAAAWQRRIRGRGELRWGRAKAPPRPSADVPGPARAGDER